jgi:hypothetical protein
MSDPTRWRDEQTGLTAGAGGLLRGTRRPQPPAPHALERLGAAIDGIYRRPPPPSGLRLALAGAVAFAIAGGGTVGWALHVRNEKRAAAEAAAAAVEADARETARVRRPTIAALAPAAPAPAAPAPVKVRRHAPAEPRVAAPAPAPVEAVSPNDMLAREVPLIDAGRSELATSPSRALATLETHRREFPRGQLAAEREFLAVQALVQMNRIEDAKQRADELATRFPASSYAARAARAIREVEAQRAAAPALDGSRGTQRPGRQRQQRNDDRL